jgi:hypothetical protein
VVWKTRKLHQEAKAKGYIVMGNSADEEIEKLRKIWPYFDFYTCDAIALKPLKGPIQVL